jgi:hypothetical protein
MRGLDPRICRWHEMAGSSQISQPMTAPSIVIPAKAGIQLHVSAQSWTLTFVRVTM